MKRHEILARKSVGMVGWCIDNTSGKYGWYSLGESGKNGIFTWWFEDANDAVVFRLRFGI